MLGSGFVAYLLFNCFSIKQLVLFFLIQLESTLYTCIDYITSLRCSLQVPNGTNATLRRESNSKSTSFSPSPLQNLGHDSSPSPSPSSDSCVDVGLAEVAEPHRIRGELEHFVIDFREALHWLPIPRCPLESALRQG